MNRQVGPSVVLSLLIVGFFSIVLYQPEHPRRRAVVTAPKSSVAKGESRILTSDHQGALVGTRLRSSEISSPLTSVLEAEAAEASAQRRIVNVGAITTERQGRKIRTAPVEFGRSTATPFRFEPAVPERATAPSGASGRWRQVRRIDPETSSF